MAYPEARVPHGRGFRENLLAEKDYHLVVAALQYDWTRYLEVSDSLVWLAGELAEKHHLRGFNAIYLVAPLILVVVACWDVRLWEAMSAVEIEVLPENRP